MKTPSWLKLLAANKIYDVFDLDEDVLKATLVSWAAQEGRTVTTTTLCPSHRTWKAEADQGYKEMVSLFESWSGHIAVDESDGNNRHHLWVFPVGYAEVKVAGDDPCGVTLVTTNAEEAELLATWFKEATVYTKPVPRVGNQVKALLRSSGYYVLKQVTWINAPFKPENYSPIVGEGFEFICEDLNSEDPQGRIIILDGPPGTGKTWLIRALIHANPKCDFVLVPPDMISELGKPDLLPTFLDHKRGSHKPLVLILEDADQMLSERMAESMTDITSALNMGDGILGEALNIRIIASTNQPLSRIDDAMKRPGRLSRRIEVGGLPFQQAADLFVSLGGVGTLLGIVEGNPDTEWGLVDQEITLAAVYKAVKVSKR